MLLNFYQQMNIILEYISRLNSITRLKISRIKGEGAVQDDKSHWLTPYIGIAGSDINDLFIAINSRVLDRARKVQPTETLFSG